MLPGEGYADHLELDNLSRQLQANNVKVSVILYPKDADRQFTQLAQETGENMFILSEETLNNRGSLSNIEQLVKYFTSIIGDGKRGNLVSFISKTSVFCVFFWLFSVYPFLKAKETFLTLMKDML